MEVDDLLVMTLQLKCSSLMSFLACLSELVYDFSHSYVHVLHVAHICNID